MDMKYKLMLPGQDFRLLLQVQNNILYVPFHLLFLQLHQYRQHGEKDSYHKQN